MLTPMQLFSLGRKLTEDDMKFNKYTYMAYKYKYPHYRIISIGDIVSHKIVKDKDLPGYLMDFIGEQGQVLIVANIVNNQVPFVQLRALKDKMFSVYGSQTRIPYGLGYIPSKFRFGDPIFICEGLCDVDTFRGIYPNIIGTLTAGLTSSQFEIVTRLTNKFILCYDNDKAGVSAYYRDKKKLMEKKCIVRYLRQYEHFKDVGDLAQQSYLGNSSEFDVAFKYYYNQSRSLIY